MARPDRPSRAADTRWSRTSVSKNTSLAFIRFEPVETETRRQSAAEFAQASQQFLRCRRPLDLKRPAPGDMDLDAVALLQSERLDHSTRKPDRQAVPPSPDLHWKNPSGYTWRFWLRSDRLAPSS